MKKLTGLFIIYGFLLAFPVLKLHAQKPFEGTITWAMTIPMMDDEKHSMIVNVKGDKNESEMDMGVQGIVKVYKDRSTKKMYIVMTAMKMGMTMDLSDINNAVDSIDIKPSGQKETIAGHPAEEYLIKGAKGDISLWVTSDFPKEIQQSFYKSLNDNPQSDPNQIKAIRELVGKGLVPIRIVVKSAGEVQMSMEFVKYEQKSLDDALFIPPQEAPVG
jgi:hypothetical protein